MTFSLQTLIHCRAGINRSGALAIAYVSWKTSTDLIETARTIKSKRYQVRLPLLNQVIVKAKLPPVVMHIEN